MRRDSSDRNLGTLRSTRCCLFPVYDDGGGDSLGFLLQACQVNGGGGASDVVRLMMIADDVC